MLLVGEEDGSDEDELEETENPHVHLDSVEVSLQSVNEFTSPHTMKLRGNIEETEVVVLIDSGATHNFISGRAG